MNLKEFKGIKSYTLEHASIVQVFDYHFDKSMFIYYSFAEKQYEVLCNQQIVQKIHRFNFNKDDYSVKPSKQRVNKLPIDYFCQFVGDWIIVTQNYKTWTIININQIEEISRYIQLDRLPGKSIKICPESQMAGTINEQGILIFDLQKGQSIYIQHSDVYQIFDINLSLNFPPYFVIISNDHPYNQIQFETTEKQKFIRNIKAIENLFYNDKFIVYSHRDSRENGGGRNVVYVHSLTNDKLLFRTTLKTNVHDCRFKHFSFDSKKITIWHNLTILELDLTNRNLDVVNNGDELKISASNCILQQQYIEQQTIVHLSTF